MKASDTQELAGQIEFLLPQHVRTMHVPWWSQFDSRSLVHQLVAHPNVSFWVPNSSQYLVGGFWRGRTEIGLILEVIGSKNRLELVRRAVERFRELDCGAAVLSAGEADRDAKWYLSQGWQVIDEIVVYTRQNCRTEGLPTPSLPVERFRPEDLDELLALERASFPYLWWSGRDDFLHYTSLPEVGTFVLRVENRMAGYVSFTQRSRQGFLDRLSVHPDLQRNGYGSLLLSFALQQLDKAGARTAALNTQIGNYRSQHLYENYGFVRTRSVERIHGLWLKEEKELEPAE